MAPLTQAEIKSHLLCSTTRKARTQTYTDLLGFRKLSQARSRSGPQAYTGRVREFYNTTKIIADELADRYGSWYNLHEEINAQDNFAQKIIDDLVEEYGPVIWSDGKTRSFVTVTDSSNEEDDERPYRRYLVYTNDDDRVSIRTFVYCLILQRTCRDMRKKTLRSEEDGAIAMEAPYTSTRSSRNEQAYILPPDPDLVSVFSSNGASRGTAASGTCEPSSSRGTERYQIPVARMVPPMNVFSPSVVPQSNAAASGLTSGGTIADAEEGCQTTEICLREQLLTSDPPLAEVSDVTSGPEEVSNNRHNSYKRKRSLCGEMTSTDFRSSDSAGTTKRALRLRRTTFAAGPSRLPSPRASPEEMETTEHQAVSDSTRHHYDITSDNEHDENDVIAVTNVRRQEVHITPVTGRIPEDEDHEIDSVQGSPRQSPAAEAHPSSPQDAEREVEEEESPSLIVVLKLMNPQEIAQRRLRRRRLALELPKAFDIPNQSPEALENMIKLINEIRALDSTQFNQVFGDRHATQQLILDQWLDLIDIYLRFRREADFHDDISMWDAHLDSLEPKQRLEKAGCLDQACVSLMEWRLENPTTLVLEWSRDVTWVLVQMAGWKRTPKTADVEEIKIRIVEFHRSLLAWFR